MSPPELRTRSLAPLGRVVQYALFTQLALQALVVAGWIAGDAFAGGYGGSSFSRLSVWFRVVAALDVCRLIAGVVGFAAFVMWMHRAYTNVDVLGGYRRYGRWMAVGGWLVPIGNAVFPFQIVRESWLVADDEAALHAADPPAWLSLWWVLCVLAVVVPIGASVMWGLFAQVIARVVYIGAVIATVVVVRRVTMRQAELAEARGMAGGPLAPVTF